MKSFFIYSIACMSVAMILFSCEQPAKAADVATAVKNSITTSGPVFSGSNWSGIPATDRSTAYRFTYDGNGNSTISTLSLAVSSASMAIKADHTFTITVTTTNGPDFGPAYVPDNWKYSSSSASLNMPSLAPSGAHTSYSYYGSDSAYGFIGATYYYGDSSLPPSAYSIGTTATTYNGLTVYPVTYKTSYGVGLTASVGTFTGTWVATDSTDPLSTAQNLVLTFVSSSTVYTTYSNTGAATTTTSTVIFPSGIGTAMNRVQSPWTISVSGKKFVYSVYLPYFLDFFFFQ